MLGVSTQPCIKRGEHDKTRHILLILKSIHLLHLSRYYLYHGVGTVLKAGNEQTYIIHYF